MTFAGGDFFASSLPLLTEHILLEYACFKIGVVFVPLDLRLKTPEVIRSLGLVRARGFAFLGKTAAADFRELARAVQQHCLFVEHLVQLSAPEETIEGAVTAEGLEAHARDVLAAYMRPLHYEILEPGTFPLNRVAKTDSVLLAERAREIVARLREQGGWDPKFDSSEPISADSGLRGCFASAVCDSESGTCA